MGYSPWGHKVLAVTGWLTRVTTVFYFSPSLAHQLIIVDMLCGMSPRSFKYINAMFLL